ncbi:MAG: hypothetical protein IT373_01985 [Polyangiaceae bacterium]|nr:hypothetical protein [Polyangiaceae bacterium]
MSAYRRWGGSFGVLLAVVLACPPVSAGEPYHVVAVSNQTVGGATIGQIASTGASISDDGDVVVLGDAMVAAELAGTLTNIFDFANTGVSPADGGTPTISGALVTFRVANSVWTWAAGVVSQRVSPADIIAAGGQVGEQVTFAGADESGGVVVVTERNLFYRSATGALTRLAGTGDAVPGYPGRTLALPSYFCGAGAEIAADGTILVAFNVLGDANHAAGEAVLLGTAGALTAVLVTDEVIPSDASLKWKHPVACGLASDTGNAVFLATTKVVASGNDGATFLFSGPETDITRSSAIDLSAIPRFTGQFVASGLSRFAFDAYDDALQVEAIVSGDALSGATFVLRAGDGAPGGETFSSVSAPQLNSVGQVLFMGTLTGGGGGIYRYTPGTGIVEIVASTDTFDLGGTVGVVTADSGGLSQRPGAGYPRNLNADGTVTYNVFYGSDVATLVTGSAAPGPPIDLELTLELTRVKTDQGNFANILMRVRNKGLASVTGGQVELDVGTVLPWGLASAVEIDVECTVTASAYVCPLAPFLQPLAPGELREFSITIKMQGDGQDGYPCDLTVSGSAVPAPDDVDSAPSDNSASLVVTCPAVEPATSTGCGSNCSAGPSGSAGGAAQVLLFLAGVGLARRRRRRA